MLKDSIAAMAVEVSAARVLAEVDLASALVEDLAGTVGLVAADSTADS